MSEYFIALLFGHLFGDYLFQTDWMALNKKKEIEPLTAHCAVYTSIVMAFMLAMTDVFAWSEFKILALTVGVLISHIILDGTHLVENWLKFYGSRSFKKMPAMDITCTEQGAVYYAYTALVVTAADNTLHLFMMYMLVKFLIKL